MIDCIDTEGTWYRSTVLNVREGPDQHIPEEEAKVISPNLPPFKEVYVAYRYYDEEEGHKTDTEGKYVGWSDKYDQWYPVTSPVVQKLKSVSRAYKVATRNTMQYDNISMTDESDTFFNNKQYKVWAVTRAGSFLNLKQITDYVNEFGAQAGFEKIYEFLSNNGKPITPKHLYFIMEFLSKTLPIW